MGRTELKVQMNQSGLLIKLATMNFLLFFCYLHDGFRSGKSNCQMKKDQFFTLIVPTPSGSKATFDKL